MDNKILAAMLVSVIVICSSMPVFAIPMFPQSSDLSQENVRLTDSKQKYGDIESQIRDIENKIYDLNIQIEPLQLTADKNKKEIENITLAIENAKKDMEQCKKEIIDLDLNFGQRVKAMYVSGNLEINYLSFVFESESTSDLFTRVQVVSNIVGKDKLAIENIDKKKQELQIKINSIQDKKDEINKLNKDIEETLDKLEGKKKEQENLIDQVNIAKSKYDLGYISELERNAVSFQFIVIDNLNSSSEEILGAIFQLTSIRNKQIKSPIVNEEIKEKIEKAKVIVEQRKKENGNMVDPNEKSCSAEGMFQQTILNEAYKHIGKSYVWGAVGEETFDCSGFTQYVYKHAENIDITRTTYTQIKIGQKVGQDELQPGDLVFPRAGHVGIYVGNGQMIHAPHEGALIKVGPVYDFYEARRII